MLFKKSNSPVIRLLLYVILFFLTVNSYGQSSVLSTGKWFKIAVDKNGVFKLTPDHFNKMGFETSKIDPRKIKVFGLSGGMLPQANAIQRPQDLIELAILSEGEADGKFDKNDFILFYGQGPDKSTFVPARNMFFVEKNLYSDKNFYFITVGDGNGKRIPSLPAGSGGVLIDQYRDFIVHEDNGVNILRSGREWFGEYFDLTKEYSFEFTIPDIVADSEINFVSDVMAQSFNPSSFKIFYNDLEIGEQIVPVIPDSQYGAKGRLKRDSLSFTASFVSASQSEKQRIKYIFNKAASGGSKGYLNFFSAHFTRKLSLSGDQTSFRNASSLNTPSRYVIGNVSDASQIWNITDPYSPAKQLFIPENNNASFSSSNSVVEEFIIFNTRHFTPQLIGEVRNQNLHGLATPDFLIVTHPDFISEANRLAEHRRAKNNYSVEVVGIDEVFNEFSSGRQDVTAIRDFAKFLYDKSPSKLKNLLLFGKCSYDYKDRLKSNTNFVPTYPSRNSLAPLETHSSDDYFAFLEPSEGQWDESESSDNHTLDIGVGRIPVKTIEEARFVVDKLIAYDENSKRFGKWRKDIVFVADDGSKSDGFSSIHQDQANDMAELIETQHPEFNTRKIFLGTYPKKVSPNGETIPKANLDIAEEFHQSVIINYTGHGSEKLWSDERILTPEDIDNLKNRLYPFLVTATCEFGRHDDPVEISSAEFSILKEKAGSIGLVTTSRPVNSSTNFSLNQAFYNALFQKDSGKPLTAGEIFRRTKNNSTTGVANRNFSLLGDPSMTIALPLQSIVVDYIKTELGSDTLKALSKVVVRGKVINLNGGTDVDFNGILNATLFDKKTDFKTIGKNNPAFQYQEWFNPLFRGQASIVNGLFEFSFILPKNIAYEVNPGKLSLYASDEDNGTDAAGSSSSFKIGESEVNPPFDDASPLMQVYMGDSTFIEGGTVSSNTTLVVKLQDDHGINISNYGIGNTMMAILDDDAEIFLINEYYLSETNDYTKGWVTYPIYNLAPGPHTLTVKAWDSYNNPVERTINFVVSDNPGLVIETFGNYPNPFSGSTTVFFTHNRPGEDLEAEFKLLNTAGAEIKTYNISLPESTYMVDLMKFEEYTDLNEKLPPGLYFGRLRVRSLSDGAESMRVAKLILAK
jgi:hypothetical protein